MNTIDRTYQVRGKQRHLQELVELAAVRSETAGAHVGRKSAMESLAPPDATQNMRAFEQAGWSFVPRGEATDGAKVFLKPNGCLALAANRLTVRLASDLSEERASEILRGHGCTIVDRLKLAPNLFVVSVPPDRDVLETAERLGSLSEVEFAEPELIEIISGR